MCKNYLLLAEIENSDGIREFGLQLLARGTARSVNQKKYRLSADFSFFEAFSRVSPFVQVPEAVIRIVDVGRDYVSE